MTVAAWLWHTYLVPFAGPLHGALLYAVGILAIWWAVLVGLYRRRWILRV